MEKKILGIVVFLLISMGGVLFAQNQQFEQLVSEMERLATDYTNFANTITRNPNSEQTRQINNLENRLINLQSRLNSWQIAMANSSSPELPTDKQQQRFLSAIDRVQKAALKIANAN